MSNVNNDEPKIDVNRAFEAIAKIMGNRYNADVRVVSVKKREEAKEDTA